MHYLCLVFRQESDASEQDTQVESRAVVEALVDSGYDIAAFQLAPPGEATTLRRTGDGVVLSDGPVTTGSARLQSVYVLKARDLNDAVRLAAWLPEASSAEVEIRPVVGWPHSLEEPSPPEEPPEDSVTSSGETVSVVG
jgi:hypothetical protein